MPKVKILLTPGLRSGFYHLGFREQQVVDVDHETCDKLEAAGLVEVIERGAKRSPGRPKGSKNKPKPEETPDKGDGEE